MTERGKSAARRGALAALAVLGLTASWMLDRGSLERANRLHRAGSLQEAASLYGTRVGEDTDPALRYNHGTSLMELGRAEAGRELDAAAATGTDQVRARALYNEGLLNLRRALDGPDGDSLRILADAAVQANRAALLLRPEHQDTKWNLAMAQRLLDSIQAGDRDSGEDTAESALEADEVVQSRNVLETDEENELPEDAPQQGEDETRANADDEDLITDAEAEEILGGGYLDPALLVRKLLALEGRSFWGRRTGLRGPRR